ncbi:MAG: mannose-1-phosphate guanyltransferase [bacterium]
MKAVVMAGGEGTRLRPVTAQKPKPLVPICNRPIMEHIICLLRKHGIIDIVTTLHYLADEIQGYFGDGADWGVNLIPSIEDTPLGTAGSVKQAEEYLKDDTFVIVSGDALTDVDLEKAIKFHKEKGSMATLILYRVQNPLEFGVVVTEEDGRILRFLEKPSWSEVFSDTVNTGMYILEPEIFDYMQPGESFDFSHDLFPALLRDGKPIYGYIMEEYWCDVGSLQQYREAQQQLLGKQVNLEIPGQEQASQVWIEPGTNIDPTAQIIPPVCIGRNCKIKANSVVGPYTVLGDNTIIDENARVERSILWDSVYIGPNTNVQGSTICSRVTIKEDCHVNEDVVIGDRCHIESGSTIRPRIKLWPDKFIEQGSTVTMSLVWGSKWRGSLFRNLGVAGLANIEITPDLACKLGAAFGASLPKGSAVVTARDPFKVSRMIKRAVISGLLSVGVDVIDLRAMPLPITRHMIRTGPTAGGVNCRISPENPRLTLLEFFDKRGVYLPKAAERKLETIFFREDFRRTDVEEIGEIEFGGRAIEQYQADFFRHIDEEAVNRARHRVVADYAFSRVATIYPVMLGRLGCEMIAVNAYPDAAKAPRSLQDRENFIDNLRQIVDTLKADMGVFFGNEGQRLTVIDNHGRVIDGHELFATMAMLVAKTHPKAMIAATVASPSELDEIVAKEGGKVMRIKTDVRSIMNVAADPSSQVVFTGDEKGGLIFPAFQPGFDAMFAFAKMLEMMAHTGATLSDLADAIPPFFVRHRQVRCPWEHKGQIMRRLTEDNREGEKVELIDGIKLYNNGTWILVLPDASEPYFHLYAESESAERSEAILDDMSKQILAMSS